MNILIIGNGGREHAIAWKVAQSKLATQVFAAPGNAGTQLEKKVKNVAIEATDIAALIEFAKKEAIDLTIVGPEAPLALGIVDQFTQHQLRCFGPTKEAAQLESSKAFSKDFMQRHHIPTARYAVFTDVESAISYLKSHPFPVVLKADGLAAGKGVVIAENFEQAEKTLKDMLQGNAFGSAGHRVVIEEFLEGEEASFIVMSDGQSILALASSQDHKRRDDGDQGPNTGGMGAYSPAPIVSKELHERVMREIIEPTIRGMKQDGIPYTGFLYAGLMINKNNEPKVLEFNCRLGDPETQVIMTRLQSDLVELCIKALNQNLASTTIQWDPRVSLGVVLAAGGYPDSYKKGDIIHLPNTISESQKIFHAGTTIKDNNVVTNGGRVLCVTALGTTVSEAQKQAYELVKQVKWNGIFYRHDIGYRAIAKEKKHEEKI